jgi:hypothetical protein
MRQAIGRGIAAHFGHLPTLRPFHGTEQAAPRRPRPASGFSALAIRRQPALAIRHLGVSSLRGAGRLLSCGPYISGVQGWWQGSILLRCVQNHAPSLTLALPL